MNTNNQPKPKKLYRISDIISVMTTDEQILEIEKEIRETPYHKGTEHHIGKLRARLARLKDRLIEQSSKKGGGRGGYAVKKQGDATIILIGPPSAGKSTLLNALTNAKSKVAPYAFTTVSVIPGMMVYKNARIQILDVPGLIEGAEEGKGRGREVLSVARGADLIVFITDFKRVEALKRIEAALERNGIRINQAPPLVLIEKKFQGGILVHSNIKHVLSKQTIKEFSQEMGIKNAEITINERLTPERLIDSFSSNRVYIKAIQVINKIDQTDSYEGDEQMKIIGISAEKGINLEKLKQEIWNQLSFLRIYLVRPDEQPDFSHPLIMKVNQNLNDVARKLGSDFLENKKRAKIWGTGSKFPGQEVSLDTKVQEGMQVRFI